MSSASIFCSANNLITFLQSQGFIIDDAVAVENFLTNCSSMVPDLYDAPRKIAEYFGGVGVKLGLFSDPDGIDSQSELYLEIETALSPEQANEKLCKINREWSLTSSNEDLMSLNLTLKFS